MLSAKFNFVGVDYGSKLAGTTVICYHSDSGFVILQSEKNQDADLWLKEQLSKINPQVVFFDAPLSLPGAYFKRGDDFYYRESDRLCKAMSPMFLGGLTARAIKLKSELLQFVFHECYPGALARQVYKLGDHYNKKKSLTIQAVESIISHIPVNEKPVLSNWHQFDALLCWLTGHRHTNGESILLGDSEEGLIIL